jgi:hypothetical protein
MAASSRLKEQPMSDEKTMGQVIQIDEARIRDHLGEMVRGTVEETLNATLDAEADRLCSAGRYERSEARQDTRAGSYDRTLHTKAGDVSLKIPKLNDQYNINAYIQCQPFLALRFFCFYYSPIPYKTRNKIQKQKNISKICTDNIPASGCPHIC